MNYSVDRLAIEDDRRLLHYAFKHSISRLFKLEQLVCFEAYKVILLACDKDTTLLIDLK